MRKKGSFFYIAIVIFVMLLGLLGYSIYVVVSKQMEINNYLEFAEEEKVIFLNSLGSDYIKVYVLSIALLFVIFLMIKLKENKRKSHIKSKKHGH